MTPPRACWNCGAETDDWDYLGDRQVSVCGQSECLRELQRVNQAMIEEAAFEAKQDQYSRYWGEGEQ